MKKKIIFVTQALWIGGIETALVNLLNRIDHDRYAVTVLTLRREREMASRLPGRCRLIVADRHEAVSLEKPYRFARLFHLTEPTTNPSRLHRALMWLTPAVKWVENRLYIRYIRENLPRERYDACVIYSDVAAETAVRAVQADKYIMFYHHGAMRRVYHDDIGYRKSSAVVAVSQIQAEKLRSFRPEYANKIRVIHNLTDVDGIREKGTTDVAAAFEPGRFHIVSCGRVSQEKGMDLAVQACARLVNAGHTNIRWWIVGGGPAEAEVRAEIARLGMQEYVSMVGMQKNPYPYIQAADLYVQPSRFEGYGLTITEALVMGNAIVSTDNGGAGEILVDGVTGVLCPISAEGIAEAVGQLLESPERLNALRENVAGLDMDAGNKVALRQLEALL